MSQAKIVNSYVDYTPLPLKLVASVFSNVRRLRVVLIILSATASRSDQIGRAKEALDFMEILEREGPRNVRMIVTTS
jgi:hypothetical protein